MSTRKGFSGEVGRHSMETRGVDLQGSPELQTARSGTYSIISAAAASDRRLGRCSPLHVLVMLGRYRNSKTGLCVPALDRIAADLGIDRRSVQRHINSLIGFGYVVAQGRRRGNGGWSSNTYTLLFPLLPSPASDDADMSGGPPTKPDCVETSEALMADDDDATLSVAYPPLPDGECVDNRSDQSSPMRHSMSQGGDTECRNPCDTECRNNNSPILTIDSNSPFAEANARARDEAECGKRDQMVVAECEHTVGAAVVIGDSMRVDGTQHEAQRRVTVIKARPAYEAPRDPLDALVKRLVNQTGVHAGRLWAQMMDWHGQIERTGLDNASAQQVLASIGRSFGHGAPSGDPIPQINARVQLWVGRREQSAA